MEQTTPPPQPAAPPAPSKLAPWRRALGFLSVAAVVFLADQATKLVIISLIPEGHAEPEEGWVQLTHITNTGSAFGLLQGQTAFLILASFIGIFGIVAYYRANAQKSLLLPLALGLVLGGALGNLYDRLFRGAVVDFIYVQLWPGFHWPAFNIADSSLVIGLLALGAYVMRQRQPSPESRSPGVPAPESSPVPPP